jgi:hypothetical protein
MLHHLLAAPSFAVWVSMFFSMLGAGIAIFFGIWRSKHPQPRGFDFAASARRIRTTPIPARDDA